MPLHESDTSCDKLSGAYRMGNGRYFVGKRASQNDGQHGCPSGPVYVARISVIQVPGEHSVIAIYFGMVIFCSQFRYVGLIISVARAYLKRQMIWPTKEMAANHYAGKTKAR